MPPLLNKEKHQLLKLLKVIKVAQLKRFIIDIFAEHKQFILLQSRPQHTHALEVGAHKLENILEIQIQVEDDDPRVGSVFDKEKVVLVDSHVKAAAK